jgi:hypothetical protein
MSINDRDAFLEAAWDWGILDGCFGGKISPSDIDGHVERNGHFLYLEAKGATAVLKRGQEIAIQNRVRDGISTYVVVFGGRGKPERLWVYYPAPSSGGNPRRTEPATLEDFRDVCTRWYQYAEGTEWSTALAAALDLRSR